MSDQQKIAGRLQAILRLLNAPERPAALSALSNMADAVDLRDFEVLPAGQGHQAEHPAMTRQAVRVLERELATLRRHLSAIERLHDQALKHAERERVQRARAEANLKVAKQKQEQKQSIDLKFLRSERFSPERSEDALIRDVQAVADQRGVDEHNTCVMRDLPLGGLVNAILIAAGYCSMEGETIRRRRTSNRPSQQIFLEHIIRHPTYRWLLACRKAYLIVLSDDWPAIDDGSFSLSVQKINDAADAFRNGLKVPRKRTTRDSKRLDQIRQVVRDRDFGTAIRLDSIWAKEDAKAEPVQ